MGFYWHNAIAIIRGLFYKWPKFPPTGTSKLNPGYSWCSVGFRDWREARDMYKHGWIPYCVQRTGCKGAPIARLFKTIDNTVYSTPEWEQ